MRREILLTSAVALLTVFESVRGSPIADADENLRSLKSREMLSYMNESANPCDDFYNFACGNWPKIHTATAVRFETNTFHLAQQEMGRKIVATLSERHADDTAVEGKVKDYYEACLELPALEVYRDKLKDIISEFGQMPVLEEDKWQEENFDWLKTVAEINHRYGFGIIVGFVILPDLDDITMNRIRVRHPKFKSLTLHLDEIQRNKYKEKITKHLSEYLGLPEALAQQTAQEIADFEATLVKGSKADPRVATETVYTTTAARLRRKYFPDLDLQRLLQIAFGSIPKGDIFEVFPEYHESLITVMKTTPKKIVANYIFYQLMIKFLPPLFEKDTKQQECQRTTTWCFANALDNMVYRKYENEFKAGKETIIRIFQDIQSFFDSALASETYYSWVSKKTRKRAVDKLRAMTIKINSYEEINFEEEYGSLEMDKHDYVGNMKSIYSLQANKTRAKLNEKVKPYYDPLTGYFSPEYVITENLIHMPLAILQPSFFYSTAYPKAVNFAKVGFLLGHEMIHAFDDLGRNHDKSGNLKNWWDRQSTRNFNTNTECFRNQMANFTYNGQPIPRLQYQAENIADNGGIRLAFEAYTTWYHRALLPQSDRDLELLPDLSYKNKQLFFISYAQVWCTDTHRDLMKSIVLNDDHLPASLRVIGPMSNYDKFAEAFNCPQGEGMNPEKKCQIY